VTDDQITAFLNEHLVDGKVYISSDAKNQWIRSLASRNGYSLKDFIALYGYESKQDGTELTTDGARERHMEALKNCIVHDNVVYFPTDSNIYRILSAYCHNKNVGVNEYVRSLGFDRTFERPKMKVDDLESDMQVRITSKDAKFEEVVFARYPLIGSLILKPETLEKLNQCTRKYIEKALSQSQHPSLSLRAEMQIALAIINNAKNWNNEENPNFWNYITLQFGYRNTSDTIRKLLRDSLENAMKKNHRLFIEDDNGRAFKSTVVIHALSTKKSWMALFDFLFDFYKNNLHWKVIPGDPLVELMVRNLQKKLAGESEGDAELRISSCVYSFQEGIRKLIRFRPVFTRNLFEKLIEKIDALINSKEKPVKSYEELLCEEWFKQKITAIANTKQTERQKNDVQREVAIDYSHIRIKYTLKNENNVQLVLPDIRLNQENVQRARLVVYYNDSIAFQDNLSWYGNELGKTLNGISVALPTYTGGTDAMNIRVKIICDTEIIFDSENTMVRRMLIFAGGSEVNVAQIHCNNYTIVLPASCLVEVENADITEVDSFGTPGLRAYFLELHDGFVLAVDGKLLAFDSENSTDIRVIPPSESGTLPRVTTDDAECYLARPSSSCTIILGNNDYKQQFVVMKNGERIEFSELEDAGNGLAFVCPLSGEKDFCRLQVINLRTERLVFDRSFMLVEKINCDFNREFYFTASDYEGALFHAELDNYYKETAFAAADNEIRLPFRNGELHVDIPKILIQETTGKWLNGLASAWYVGDIPQNSLLKVSNPAHTSVQILIGSKDIMYDGQGIATIGNVIQSFADVDGLGKTPVKMRVTGRKQEQWYTLTYICYRECFLSKPEFWYADGALLWNRGGTFVGKPDRIFTLTLRGENDTSFEYTLNENTECINLSEDMPVGNYRYEVSILVNSLFKQTKEVLAEGDCIIGDQNLLRFHGRRIEIDSITEEGNVEAGHIAIKPCYIDQIEFVGIEDTSDGMCPVYKGVLYTKGYRGERYEFSFKTHVSKKGITKTMVNPVRIIYLGDTTLCITDAEGDGLYYYGYYDGDGKVYAMTDREYTEKNKNNYSCADLYLYRTERI
jgi:hypothetical protein